MIFKLFFLSCHSAIFQFLPGSSTYKMEMSSHNYGEGHFNAFAFRAQLHEETKLRTELEQRDEAAAKARGRQAQLQVRQRIMERAQQKIHVVELRKKAHAYSKTLFKVKPSTFLSCASVVILSHMIPISFSFPSSPPSSLTRICGLAHVCALASTILFL